MYKNINNFFLKKDTVLCNGRGRQGRWGRRMRNRDKSKQSTTAYVYKNGVVNPITFYAYVRLYFKKTVYFYYSFLVCHSL